MSVEPLRQLVTILYEYCYFNVARLETEYIQALDRYYKDMFYTMPERRVTEYELVDLLNKNLTVFVKLQNFIQVVLNFSKLF